MNRKQRRITQSRSHAAPTGGGDPSSIREFRDALEHLRQGRLHDAEQGHRRILARSPRHAPSLFQLGLIAAKGNAREQAVDYIRQSLAIEAGNHQAWLSLATLLGKLRRMDGAIDACRRSIALRQTEPKTHALLGNLLHATKNDSEAIAAYEASLQLKPDQPLVLTRMGELLLLAGKSEQALSLCRRARALDPDLADAHRLEQRISAATGDFAATDSMVGAVSGDPDARARSYEELGSFLRTRGRHAEAVTIYRRAIADAPDRAEHHFNLALALEGAGEKQAAMAAYQAGLAIEPERADAYAMLGVLLRGMDMHAGAVQALEHAVKLDPSLAVAHYNLAVSYKLLRRLDDARDALKRAVECAPDSLVNRFELSSIRRLICDWDGLAEEEDCILELFRGGSTVVAPFQLISMRSTRADQLEAGRRFVPRTLVTENMRLRPHREMDGSDRRIRIGYLSSDFFDHATPMLLVEILEQADRNRFELFGYCYSPDDNSEIRRRIIKTFDHYVPVGGLSNQAAAEKIRADGIDILVDLKGYTRDARMEILSYRPAPIQVAYLGYPATMGAEFVDYMLADAVVAPMEHQDDYTERIVHLPHCYQPNDRQRKISWEPITRAQCGLPDDAFVFCSFNTSIKFNAQTFDIWMRLLDKTPGSVLWLLSASDSCRDNLRREAAARNIDPDRLVFAERLPIAQHLARHKLADLFLDSLPCNAHTTASDALWAGLPVLTCLGETFSGRVAASLLTAMELPELIAASMDEYERTALAFAADKSRLEPIRRKILAGRDTSPLFDSARYTKNLERAYETMMDIMRAGEAPRPFTVTEHQAAPTQPATPESPDFDAHIAYEACPLCDGTNIPHLVEARVTNHPLYKPQLPPSMKWRGCESCGHVFTEGHYTPEACEIIFSATHANQKVGSDMENQRKVSARMVERVARYASSGDWLDIGVGNGSLLFTAAEWGYGAVGTDLRRENVELLRKLGYEAHCADIEELDAVNRFSVVSMADVLEHVPFPRRSLTAVHSMMKRGGALFVSMPNMDTIVWRTLDATSANPYWGELEHYHNFTRKRLVQLLESQGFRFAEYNISERYRTCMEVIAIKV